MRRLINPILGKEIKLNARTFKFPMAVAVYSLIISGIALMMFGSNTSMFGGIRVDYNSLTYCFPILAFVQLAVICIIIPILTASSIAGEREKQTLEILLTTPVSPFSIVFGKLASSLCTLFIYVVATLPAMSLFFLYGGISWVCILKFVVGIMVVSFMIGAIGIWCSAVYKKTITSIIMSLIFEIILFIGTVILVAVLCANKLAPYINNSFPSNRINIGWMPAILMLNPASGILNSIISQFMGLNVMGAMMESGFGGGIFVINPHFINMAQHWTVVNYLVCIIVGFIFMGLAARKIDSDRIKSSKQEKKLRKAAAK